MENKMSFMVPLSLLLHAAVSLREYRQRIPGRAESETNRPSSPLFAASHTKSKRIGVLPKSNTLLEVRLLKYQSAEQTQSPVSVPFLTSQGKKGGWVGGSL